MNPYKGLKYPISQLMFTTHTQHIMGNNGRNAKKIFNRGKGLLVFLPELGLTFRSFILMSKCPTSN